MIKKFIHDYFTFTRGERFAVIVLSLSLLGITLLPRLLPPKRQLVDSKEAALFSQELSRIKVADTSEEHNHARWPFKEMENPGGYRKAREPIRSMRLFRFDPNTISGNEWEMLGVPDKTVSVIEHYREKGGKFRQPGDLRKIYGINAELADRLMPYADIGNTEKPPPKSVYSAGKREDWSYPKSRPDKPSGLLNVSVADSIALVELPGIGPRLAMRIINFREKLGGFYSVDQLGETYGLPDSTFQKLKPQLTVSGESVKKISLNSVTLKALKTHPYVSWNIARAIITYRDEHGSFSSVEDLGKIDLINAEWLRKMRPYLEL